MSFLSSVGGSLGGAHLGDAVVLVSADLTKLKKDMVGARKEVEKGTASMGTAFKSLTPLIATTAVAALGAFTVAAVKAASDETEALNKTNQVFKTSSGVVTDFADTSAESFGISKTAAFEAAGGFGNMLQAAGLAVDKSAEMSVELTGLAADLASFNNVDPAEALAKLASGLSGQARPLRAYGILLSEGRVEQEAYRSGIAEVGAELTDAQKVQARYNIIFQDSIRAQGDFSRTSGELANSQRILKAEWEDLSAQLGQSLLPLMKELIHALQGVASVLSFTVDHFAGLADAALHSVGPIGDAARAIAAISSAAVDSDANFSAYEQGLADIGGQIHAGNLDFNEAVSAITELQDQYGITATSASEIALKLKDMTTEQLLNVAATNSASEASGNLQDQFAAEQQAAIDDAAALDRKTQAMKDQKAASDALAGGVLGLVSNLETLAEDQKTINRLQAQGKTHTQAYREATLALLGDQDSLNGAFTDMAHSMKTNNLTLKDAKAKLFDLGKQAGLSKNDVRALASDAIEYLRGKLQGASGAAKDLGTNLRALDGLTVTATVFIDEQIRQGGKLD